jgi:GT2 family glycosyltransferase
VVSLTWNSARFIDAMLRTLYADIEGSGIETEVIVLDNGSTDDTRTLIRAVQATQPTLQLVPLDSNQGTTKSRNIGIRMAKGQFILILDSDTEIPKGTLQALLDATVEIPDPDRIGMVCPRLEYPNGDFQESARRFPTLLTKAYRLLRLEQLRKRDETLPEVIAGQTTQVDYAISAGWFVPRRTFDAVGLLDEEIFYSPEDVEFCARVWRNGLRVWYYPKARIIHNCQRLTNKKPFSRLGLSHAKGLLRYWWLYDGFLSRPGRERRT